MSTQRSARMEAQLFSAHVCLAIPHNMLDMFRRLCLNLFAIVILDSLRAAPICGREGPRRLLNSAAGQVRIKGPYLIQIGIAPAPVSLNFQAAQPCERGELLEALPLCIISGGHGVSSELQALKVGEQSGQLPMLHEH